MKEKKNAFRFETHSHNNNKEQKNGNIESLKSLCTFEHYENCLRYIGL